MNKKTHYHRNGRGMCGTETKNLTHDHRLVTCGNCLTLIKPILRQLKKSQLRLDSSYWETYERTRNFIAAFNKISNGWPTIEESAHRLGISYLRILDFTNETLLFLLPPNNGTKDEWMRRVTIEQ